MVRTERVLAATLALFGTAVFVSACTNPHSSTATSNNDPTQPGCTTCTSSGGSSSGDTSSSSSSGGSSGAAPPPAASPTNGIKDGDETDVDCGGTVAPKCAVGKSCLVDSDCTIACNYAKKCIDAPSCVNHLGGDTCGLGEEGAAGTMHESCCKSLPVSGFTDPTHPGKKVYLDKYEITAGRIRTWIAKITQEMGGKPDVHGWIQAHRPTIWDPAWDTFLPQDHNGPSVVIARRLLGDPRPEDNGDKGPPGPGVILPPPTDQPRNMGTDYQFGSEVYVDLHGSDCATWDGSYGYPTYYYPASILAHDAEMARADGTTYSGAKVSAQDLNDVKSMNCITNEMMAAFCAWDGGQLATDEVLDYITQSPPTLGNISGCGTQIDNHGELLSNDFTHTIRTGGVCPPVDLINATFDGGDNLPVPGSILNVHNYHYPDLGSQTADKAWEVSAPGRASLAMGAGGAAVDAIALHPGEEPWMDLAGNLSEAVLDTNGGAFTGVFGLKYRGIGYGSARSDLNMTLMKGETILRIQRPEAKAGFTGGRCMRFK